MAAILLQVWRSEAVKTKKRLGRRSHNSDLSSLFSAAAVKSLLTVLPFILKSVLIWMTNYVIILLQTPTPVRGRWSLPLGFWETGPHS